MASRQRIALLVPVSLVLSALFWYGSRYYLTLEAPREFFVKTGVAATLVAIVCLGGVARWRGGSIGARLMLAFTTLAAGSNGVGGLYMCFKPLSDSPILPLLPLLSAIVLEVGLLCAILASAGA